MSDIQQPNRLIQLARSILKLRFIKFGMVGASGIVVNMAVLTLCHEYLFAAIEPSGSRPYFSLVVAIAVSTLSNFSINRYWTWGGSAKAKQPHGWKNLRLELMKYVTASGFGIFLQYVLTLILSGVMEYRIANLIAIVIASVCNFIAHDKWTFKYRNRG